MKLKYQLRGIGIGLLVTTIILTIAHNLRDVAPTESNPKETASTGSILAFDKDAIDSETTAQKESVDGTTQSAQQTQAESRPQLTNGEEVEIHIIDVYYASQASDILYDAGVIKDKDEFTKYLGDHGYAVRIEEGYYRVKVGDLYENIAKIITRSE